HADFLSGARELARATGARPVLSDEGGDGWRYAWAAEAGALLVKDGAKLMVGNIAVDVLHTPGHTPEHICFRITDTKATTRPMGVFTGDFVFVGDVGRPDLLEKAAGQAGTMETAARTLFASLQRFKQLPDYLQLWPGHGAGSACGKALGAVPSSTAGYERFANWAFTADEEDDFVAQVLAGQPEPPAYFAQMKRLNRDGPPARRTTRPDRIPGNALRDLVGEGAAVADTRRTLDFAAGHVRGSLNIPFGSSLATYAGSVLPYDKPIYLVARESALDEVITALASVGLDDVAGWLPPEDIGAPLDSTTQLPAAEAARQALAGDVTIVDVRRQSEWDEGHVAGAIHIPLAEVAARVAEIPPDRPVVLHCEGGGRSAVAAAVLRSLGRHDVANLQGGIKAWIKAGLPVEKDELARIAPERRGG
ncbi:MAG TPA: MBL fold metallo-hydrolase, partial [Gemmatimonadales bacterium]